jgi:hypothetical protein
MKSVASYSNLTSINVAVLDLRAICIPLCVLAET